MDGWLAVYSCGKIYYEFYDEGQLLITCCRECRDDILIKSKLPLKMINTEESAILQRISMFPN